MKIVTLVWSIGTGGTERAAVNYAIGYKKYGSDSRVLVLGEGHERYTELNDSGVQVTLLTRSAANQADIFSSFRQWEPDIIHIHAFSDALLHYIRLIAGPLTRVVETNVFSRPVFQDSYSHVHLSLQLTSWGYWRYTRRMCCAPYRPQAAVVPYIVNTGKFSKPGESRLTTFRKAYGIPEDAFLIGRVGQAHPSKWDKRLIEVIRHTIEPVNNIYYILVGVPVSLAQVISEQDNFFCSRVKMIDHISGDDELAVFYHSLNCFAHISSIGESFGYVLAEAIACSVPVITMLTPLRDNGQNEVVGEGPGRYCVQDTKKFIGRVKQLYNDSLSGLKLQSGLEKIEEQYSLNTVMPGLLKLYDSLLRNEKVMTYYNPGVIRGYFNHTLRGRILTSLLVKLVNTCIFYKLTRLWKK